MDDHINYKQLIKDLIGAIVDQGISAIPGLPEPAQKLLRAGLKEPLVWLLGHGLDEHKSVPELKRLAELSAMALLDMDQLTGQPPDAVIGRRGFRAHRANHDALCAVLTEVNYAFACHAEAAREAAREAHCWQQQQECAFMHLERRWWYGPGWAPHKPLTELCTALEPFTSLQHNLQVSSAALVMSHSPTPDTVPRIPIQPGTSSQRYGLQAVNAPVSRSVHSEPSLPERFVQHSDLVHRIEGLPASTYNVGIIGMGGIGKTTIARAVFDRAARSGKYDCRVWLTAGREATSRADVYAQLEVAAVELFREVPSVDADDLLADLAVRLLQEGKRVLLVIDDVWKTACAAVAALNFATRPESRTEGSRLIVTTRDEATLSYHPDETPVQLMPDLERVEVKPLEPEPARQLFYHHAFGDDAAAALEESAQEEHVQPEHVQPENVQPENVQSEHVQPERIRIHVVCRDLINECGGNPLALEVTGGNLRNRPVEQWQQRLQHLNALREQGTDKVTKQCAVSVDALPASLLECFVDFAAFPEDARVPEADLLHLFATHAPLHTPEAVRGAKLKLQQLIQKSLVTKDVKYVEAKYHMHDILRSIAVRKANAEGSARWFYSGSNSIRSATVRCFSLAVPKPLKEALLGGGVDTDKLYACVMSHTKPEPPPKQKYFGGCDRAVHWPSMSRLRYLHCAALHNPEDTEGLFRRLEAGAKMPQLNFASFRNCLDVAALVKVVLPAAQLIHLDLRECMHLEQLPDSIGGCVQLAHLDLSDCKYLRHLPDSICNCSHLTRIRLNGCKSFTHLPDGIGRCTELARLDLRVVWEMRTLPCSMRDCSSLQHLDLRLCKGLTELPTDIGDCAQLAHLDLGDTGITDLPTKLQFCTRLMHFTFYDSGLEVLPEAFHHFKQLVYLNLERSKRLAYVFAHDSVTAGPAGGATSSQAAARNAAAPTDLWKHLQHLDLSACFRLVELPALHCCTALTALILSVCKTLKQLPDSITACVNLAHLELIQCSSLEGLPDGIRGCKGLTYLGLGMCQRIQRLPDCLGLCHHLVELDLWNCTQLQKLPNSITCCSNLTLLELSECQRIVELPQDISSCTAMQELHLNFCTGLHGKQLPSLVGCTGLRQIGLVDVQLEASPQVPEGTQVLRHRFEVTEYSPRKRMMRTALFRIERSDYFMMLSG